MEFKRLGEVTLVEEAVDTANVLIEENGEIYVSDSSCLSQRRFFDDP